MKILKILVIGLWAVIFGTYLKKEGLIPFLSSKPLTYYDLLGKQSEKDEYLGIYFEDKKIGFSKTSMGPFSLSEGKVGFQITNKTEMILGLLGTPSKVTIDGELNIDEEYRLSSFAYTISSAPYKLSAKGIRRGKQIEITLCSGEKEISKRLLAEKDFFFGSELLPLSIFPNLRSQKEYTIDAIDPFGIMGEEKIKIKVCGKTTVEYDKELCEAVRIEVTYQQLQTTIYAKPDGTILRAELPYGITAKKEEQKRAKPISSNVTLPNIASTSSNITIANPGEASYLSAKLTLSKPSDLCLSSPRQKFENGLLEIKPVFLPKEAKVFPMKGMDGLSETTLVQSKNPMIINLAKEIIGTETDSLKAAVEIMDWVYENIKKRPSFGVPSALEVAQYRTGDCNEHTTLFVGLCRSLGIPAKMIVGLTYYEKRFYYHAWAQVYCGEWIDIDPTLGQIPVDATHIQLIEGDIDKQAKVLGLLQELSIEVLEVRYN
ncbi:MAG: transglutaminase-like domain-containing protein [bacterium]|nr:transglutaminase-like domain-containing protein [bacterium]